jgi:hypothetical protein
VLRVPAAALANDEDGIVGDVEAPLLLVLVVDNDGRLVIGGPEELELGDERGEGGAAR